MLVLAVYGQLTGMAPDFCQPHDWCKRWDVVTSENVGSEQSALICGSKL